MSGGRIHYRIVGVRLSTIDVAGSNTDTVGSGRKSAALGPQKLARASVAAAKQDGRNPSTTTGEVAATNRTNAVIFGGANLAVVDRRG